SSQLATRPPSQGSRSKTSTATPRSASPVAAASPAIPPPTTTARGLLVSALAWPTPVGARCRTILRSVTPAPTHARQEGVHHTPLPAGHRLAVDRGEPGVGEPAPEPGHAVERRDTEIGRASWRGRVSTWRVQV